MDAFPISPEVMRLLGLLTATFVLTRYFGRLGAVMMMWPTVVMVQAMGDDVVTAGAAADALSLPVKHPATVPYLILTFLGASIPVLVGLLAGALLRKRPKLEESRRRMREEDRWVRRPKVRLSDDPALTPQGLLAPRDEPLPIKAPVFSAAIASRSEAGQRASGSRH
jgi:hypothetical protein